VCGTTTRGGSGSSSRRSSSRGPSRGSESGAGIGVTSSCSSEDARDGSPGSLLVKVAIIEERVTLARESLRNPRVLVRHTPDSDTNAAGDIEARAHDVGVVISLGGEGGRRGRKAGVADVELGIGDLEAEGREATEGGGEVGAGWRAADDEMALETDAVDGGAGILDDGDGFVDAIGLGAVVLEVVVVVVPWRDQYAVRNMGVKEEEKEKRLTAWCWRQPSWLR
jgi:hypothetical protein